MRSLEFYFFGDIGNFDSYNPSYVLNKEKVPEILYLIAEHQPFSICSEDIKRKFGISSNECNEIIESLKRIGAVDEKYDFYKINFPVFLECDVRDMNNYINGIGKAVGDKIIALKSSIYDGISKLRCSKYFSRERVLYHIICDMIFDGRAFDYFEKEKLFTVSKNQPGDRNYIVIGYEKNSYVQKQSDKLLCSSNNYRSGRFVFNSFGDADGKRNDMFRYFRTVEEKVFDTGINQNLNTVYSKILDGYNKDIACECGEIIEKISDGSVNYNDINKDKCALYDLLKEMNYIEIDDEGMLAVSVPVFYKREINKEIEAVSNMVLQSINPYIEEVLNNIESDAAFLTAVKHGVDIKDIGNEIYHQIFGSTNEYLVNEGFVAKPGKKNNEGRYLKSIRIN